MFMHWNDLDPRFSMFGDFRSQLDRAWNLRDARVSRETVAGAAKGPTIRAQETESALVLTAEIPGLRERDVTVTFHEGVLTITGERKSDVPDGYHVHRQERAPYKFSQSISLSPKIDAGRATAVVQAGVLTIELPKVAEAKPVQITVRAHD